MFVIGTAGHVDHGKSALVEALTGIDPDRLAEEKARGMTIDLGFAWLTLPDGRSVSIVDVPGHERFIRNMLAGAGGVDLALLVVAADDGVMPQTREHVAILDLLGVRHGVVALTKIDLADAEWLALVEADIAELIAPTSLAGSAIVRCSAVTRGGLDALTEAIVCALDRLPERRTTGRPRLPIDRVFTIGGFGTVVTGTLLDGELRTGDEVEILPGGLRARIRGLQSHRDRIDVATPGMRTAVNLAGVAKDELSRGLVLTTPGWLRATRVFDARVRSVAQRALPHNAHLMIHAGAAEASAQLRLLEDDALPPGGESWAQIKLDRDLALVRGDRFVLRTPDDTVAGGVAVDIAPRRHRRRDQAMLADLERLLSENPEDRVLRALDSRPLVDTGTIVAVSGVELTTAVAVLEGLAERDVIARIDVNGTQLFARREALRGLDDAATALVGAYHEAHPLRPGMPAEEMRSRLRLDARQLEALLASSASLRAHGSAVSLAAFEPAPSPAHQAEIERCLAALRAAPEHPPTVTLSSDVAAYLVERGLIVDAGDGIIFYAEAYTSMRDRVVEHIRSNGSITLAQARDLLSTSRKHAQALLEHMDRSRLTRRVGDERVLR